MGILDLDTSKTYRGAITGHLERMEGHVPASSPLWVLPNGVEPQETREPMA